MAERSAVRLTNHNRAWTFRKALMAWPITNRPFRQPVPIYTLCVGVGIILAWAPFAWALWSVGFGIVGTGITLMPLYYLFRWIVGREPTGAGILPTVSMSIGTAGAWLIAVVKPRRRKFRARSRARRIPPQMPRLAKLAALALYLRVLRGATTSETA